MYEFYVVKGHRLDDLINLSTMERAFMHRAMIDYLEMMEKMMSGATRGGEYDR